MTIFTPQSMKELTIKLCQIPSVSGNAEAENACAQAIYEELLKVEPVVPNTFTVEVIDCEGDALNRKAVMGLLRAGRKTARTILLTGHFDVVDTQDCGVLAKMAFDPEAYTAEIGHHPISNDARLDWESGNWLFGRGTMDMKAGLAIFIEAIKKFATDPDLNVNLAFLAVPDEESNSAGMRGTMKAFLEMIRQEELEMIAALTGEPCFWTSKTEKQPALRPYYTGTTGKIMPMFLAIGLEAHVNDYYRGVSAALIAANIVREVEGNPELIDGRGADVLPPPACLSLEVRRRVYSVTLPQRAVCYFNVLTTSKTPAEILQWSLGAAKRAGLATSAQMITSAVSYSAHGGHARVPSSIKVMTVHNVIDALALKLGSHEAVREKMKAFVASLPSDTDAREMSVATAEWLVAQAGILGPAIIVGFVPPYYPQRLNHRKNENERHLRRVIEDMAHEAGLLAGDGATYMTEVFGGITDLSFLGFEGEREDLQALADNTPAWGDAYWLPMEELLAMDIPIANMGPAGRDAHKWTERLELKYSFEIIPNLLVKTIKRLADHN